MKFVDDFMGWWSASNSTNGGVILTGVAIFIITAILGFLFGGWNEKRKLTILDNHEKSKDINEVLSFNVESTKSTGNMRDVVLKVHNSSSEKRIVEIDSELVDAGDPMNPMRRATDISFSGQIEVSPNLTEILRIGRLVNVGRGPGGVMCILKVTPEGEGQGFETKKRVRHV